MLDPGEWNKFTDHYLEVPFDLSGNVYNRKLTQTIPRALLDRMEVIELSKLYRGGKVLIAENYLIPKQL